MLSVVIPVYDERETLAQLVAEVDEVAREHELDLEILFVDDGSGDIEIDDVERDLIIEEEGSGSLRYTNVRGTVRQRD